MMQALTPFSSKTDEIMSRFRPIAPKPDHNSPCDAPLVPEKFRQSPYLRTIWSHLQSRPTRTRKRCRSSTLSPPSPTPSVKRQRGAPLCGFMGFCPTSPARMVTLPLLKVGLEEEREREREKEEFDLNNAAAVVAAAEKGLEEKDLLLQLQVPVTPPKLPTLISPRPVRPVGSSISVGCVTEEPGSVALAGVKAAEEVEAEVEAEELPAVISDSNNKVRMANSAYKELVGQPECSWLDSMGRSGTRIAGEVALRWSGPVLEKGFTCWVRIEWEREGGKKCEVNAFCEVMRVVCEAKDYLFAWRFHTRDVSPSGSKV